MWGYHAAFIGGRIKVETGSNKLPNPEPIPAYLNTANQYTGRGQASFCGNVVACPRFEPATGLRQLSVAAPSAGRWPRRLVNSP